jgi:hypothetical protein
LVTYLGAVPPASSHLVVPAERETGDAVVAARSASSSAAVPLQGRFLLALVARFGVEDDALWRALVSLMAVYTKRVERGLGYLCCPGNRIDRVVV